ncbi:MAG: acyltransferase [Planctomycetota bacterium]|nr:acyltransferase [Planctomycetota bacterium]
MTSIGLESTLLCPEKGVVEVEPERPISRRFVFLDGLRGIAAIWVVLFHAHAGNHLNNLAEKLPAWIVWGVFELGHLGVAIFFVLSGFVIAHSLRDAEVDGRFLGRFMLRRSIRLDPPYFASIALVVGLAWLSARIKQEPYSLPSTSVVIAHLCYVPGLLRLPLINDVYWTLCYEVQFYLVFCILLGLGQRLLPSKPRAIFIPVATISLLWGTGLLPENLLPGLFTNLWYGFLLGVFGYWVWQGRLPKLVFVIYAALIGATACWRQDAFAVVCCITACCLIPGANSNWLNWRWVQFLGAISYSLYLTHNPISGASYFILRKYLGESALSEFFMLIAVIVSCVVGAWLVWFAIERPFIRFAKRVQVDSASPAKSANIA